MSNSVSFLKYRDVADFRNGLNFSKESHGKGCLLIGVADFKDYFSPQWTSLGEINPFDVAKEDDYLKKGDIIFVRSNGNKALVGRSLYIDRDVKSLFSGFCIRARPKTDDFYPLFLAYFAKTKRFSSSINSVAGTNINNLNQDILGNVKIPLYSKNIQKSIVDVLSSIDKKIDLNNRINVELEAMAKTLYDYWFVQFDFPDANGKPYKTSGGKMVYNETLKREIPAIWNSCKLSEFIKLEYGKPLKSENRTGSGYPVFGSSGIVGFHNDYLVEGPGIIVGRKGTVGKVNFSFENFYPIDTAYYVNPKKRISMIFLNYLISSLGLESMNSDSAVPGLNRETALGISIVSAPLELISKYHEHVVGWFDKKKLIVEENNTLIKLRDWFLPLLMNGQVTVK
ncbi:restriction endonuclease subunit S [Salmonella enterica subsp. enterica]|nr:restriction endonuclease subunit S [Salmonella enterica subsp. enterica serovar Durham]EBB7906858.1 restriction endonuclease subunit S [Salmonella enterica]EBX1546815.1 restriction endonuclease subunit S [Salmonella enterica subsp. enterica serovar Wa]ECF5808594.1 restriction endonuclease subunit S [Salmonella enterica subsp. enterica serovar Bahati]ECH0864615.1 restriction endonuclease subunit S [Salmonella enterica subsp. enterica serovar Diguel]